MPIKLDDMLRAMHNAVVKAQQIAEQQHMRMLLNYFNFDDPESKTLYSETERWRPKVTILKLPRVVDKKTEDGTRTELEYQNVEVPLIALTPPTSMRIDTVTISFKANLMGFESEEAQKKGFHISDLLPKFGEKGSEEGKEEKKGKGGEPKSDLHRGAPMIDFRGRNAQAQALIRITFKNGDPPETFARIGDRLMKNLPL